MRWTVAEVHERGEMSVAAAAQRRPRRVNRARMFSLLVGASVAADKLRFFSGMAITSSSLSPSCATGVGRFRFWIAPEFWRSSMDSRVPSNLDAIEKAHLFRLAPLIAGPPATLNGATVKALPAV